MGYVSAKALLAWNRNYWEARKRERQARVEREMESWKPFLSLLAPDDLGTVCYWGA